MAEVAPEGVRNSKIKVLTDKTNEIAHQLSGRFSSTTVAKAGMKIFKDHTDQEQRTRKVRTKVLAEELHSQSQTFLLYFSVLVYLTMLSVTAILFSNMVAVDTSYEPVNALRDVIEGAHFKDANGFRVSLTDIGNEPDLYTWLRTALIPAFSANDWYSDTFFDQESELVDEDDRITDVTWNDDTQKYTYGSIDRTMYRKYNRIVSGIHILQNRSGVQKCQTEDYMEDSKAPYYYHNCWRFNPGGGTPGNRYKFMKNEAWNILDSADIAPKTWVAGKIPNVTGLKHDSLKGIFYNFEKALTWIQREQCNASAIDAAVTSQLGKDLDCSDDDDLKTAALDLISTWVNSSYHSDSFVLDFAEPDAVNAGMLHFLEMNNWIDPATKIVTVRVPGYNYHHGVFVMAEIIFEFERGGKIEPKLKMAAMKLSNYPNSSRSWLEIIFAVAFMILLLLELFTLVRTIQGQQGHGILVYFMDWKSWIDWTTYWSMGISTYYWYLINFSSVSREWKWEPKEPLKFIVYNVQGQETLSGMWTGLRLNLVRFHYMRGLMGIGMLCMSFRCLKVFAPFPDTGILVNTLTKSVKKSVYFLFMVGILMLGFACAGHLWFGAQIKEFRTLTNSLQSSFDVLLGEWDLEALKAVDDETFIGKLSFYIYFYGLNIVMNWCMLNVLIAIICSAFDDSVEVAKKNVKKVFDPYFSIWGGGWKYRHALGNAVDRLHDEGKEVVVVGDILDMLENDTEIPKSVVKHLEDSLLLDHINTTDSNESEGDEDQAATLREVVPRLNRMEENITELLNLLRNKSAAME